MLLDNIVGIRIRHLREQRDIEQKDLAQTFGISKQTLSGYETGYRTPSIEFIVKLADYFEVTTDYILGRNDNPS